MFENIEQLEKEVEEFQQNILTSAEFIKKMDGIIATVTAQERSYTARSSELTSKIDSYADTIHASQAEALIKLITEFKKSVSELIEVANTVNSSLQAQSEAFTSRYEDFLHSMSELNQTQLSHTAELISTSQKEYLRRIEETDVSIKHCESELIRKYEDFLAKLESTNVDQMFKVCQEIKKSMDTKILILSIGLGASILLMVVSLFIR